MKVYKIVLCLTLIAVLSTVSVYARMAKPPSGTKKLDLQHWHNVGNIWLRVSNYGFFGSGDDVVPQYPSLEYPGGSGIDYLYQGALWFGAKKSRRDAAGRLLYWLANNPSADSSAVITQDSPLWNPTRKAVIDTLVTSGFDGDKDLYEFLPAYNPLVAGNAAVQDQYNFYNPHDEIKTASSRTQRRGVDDDGDGIIDEDFVGYTFPLRQGSELPDIFSSFGGQHIHNTNNYGIINEGNNIEIWFPLGFMDMSDRTYTSYAFTMPHDDDNDGRIDEDGAPVSEQDYIGYYYDYCPFGTPGDRDFGSSRSTNTHVPLNVRVRQMSYQWSYEYIKNLVYVEFNITNMNIATQDTLLDCAMGIYMDCDTGPQSYGSEKASDDLSGYVKGQNYEFAYTRDADGDGGLTTGLIGARVCTPDPDLLKFHCWYWKVGDGPNDFSPLSFNYSPRRTANEKYWLLTGKNPNDTKFQPLRPEQDDVTEFEQPTANDTRFLFSFYGAQPGTSEYNEIVDGIYHKRWNLAPGRTMKIVVAVFPGDNLEDLKRTARWAKDIYGQAQTLTNVVLPDTFPHYNPPEPPEIPKLFAELMGNGDAIDMYWDNRSEFSYDVKTVSSAVFGWQDNKPFLDSHISNYDPLTFPAEFAPGLEPYNYNATINPWTAYRLRHDFQGYTIWGRSGSGSQEDWQMVERWDKIDTAQDHADYNVNPDADTLFIDYGGNLGIDKGLPNPRIAEASDATYFKQDEYFALVPIQVGDEIYGKPIYNHLMERDVLINPNTYQPDPAGIPLFEVANQIATIDDRPTPEEMILQARLFKHPDIREDIFDVMNDTKMIPLKGHGGQVYIPSAENNWDTEGLTELKKKRLSRRYYNAAIASPPKGVEYYIAATAWDRGIPSNDLFSLETGRDADANMKIFFPGPKARENMDNIYVVPNPYISRSKFDGRREGDTKGDKSRRLWFVNLPKQCTIRIYTLAGDLVNTIEHNGEYHEDIINVSKAATLGIAAEGIHSWNLLSKNRQIIAPGVYLYSVENKSNSKIKVGKFVIIK